jgi:hypothetical protein
MDAKKHESEVEPVRMRSSELLLPENVHFLSAGDVRSSNCTKVLAFPSFDFSSKMI